MSVCAPVNVIQGGSSDYASYWSMSAGPNPESFPVISTGGPDGGAYIEISDFLDSYVIVRQNIASMTIGEQYEARLAWSLSSESVTAQCEFELQIDSVTVGAAGAGVAAGISTPWELMTATYTPTTSTGVPFVIIISCSQGESGTNPIVGLADIELVNICSSSTSSSAVPTSTSSSPWTVSPSSSPLTTSTSSYLSTSSTGVISTTSDGSLGSISDTLSTVTASTSSITATPTTSASSILSVATGTAVTNADGSTTITAGTTDGTSIAATETVDTNGLTTSLDGTLSVGSDTTASDSKKKRTDAVSCTLYITQGSDVISTTQVNSGSSGVFTACLEDGSSDNTSLSLTVICSDEGATVEISGLVLSSGTAAVQACQTAVSAASSSAVVHSSSVTVLVGSSSSTAITSPRLPVPSTSYSRNLAMSTSPVSSYRSGTRTATTAGTTTPISALISASDYSPRPEPIFTTSTVFTTSVHTVTSCPATITNCPASQKTTSFITEVLSAYTTICPVTAISTGASTSPAFSDSQGLSSVSGVSSTTDVSTAAVPGSSKTSQGFQPGDSSSDSTLSSTPLSTGSASSSISVPAPAYAGGASVLFSSTLTMVFALFMSFFV